MTPLTVVKVLLALVPSAVIAVMHTTMIRASMTAYSTAVGPSSFFRKATRCCVNFCMVPRPFYLFVRVFEWKSSVRRGEQTQAARSPRCSGSAAGLADLGADVAVRLVGVGAQRRDRGDAHHDDQ